MQKAVRRCLRLQRMPAAATYSHELFKHLQICLPRLSTALPSLRFLNTASGDSKQLEQSPSSYLSIDRNSETRVVKIGLNRPAKLNALDDDAWTDLRNVFDACDSDPKCRAIVLHGGSSRHFGAGIDLQAMQSHFADSMSAADTARNAFNFLSVIKRYQDALSAIERCKKPVIAAIHGACIGGAIDMVCAADIRYCSTDAYFQIKEVDIGMAADVGTLQRFPKQIGNDSLARELALTSRRFYADEALQLGFVSRILCERDQLLTAATDIAVAIAAKSPVAVQGTKINLNYSRDHTVEEGLEFMRAWNMGMLQTKDLMKSIMRGASSKKGKARETEHASDFNDV